MSISALCDSIKENRVDDVKRLLDSGVSVLAADEYRNTLAHIAAEAGSLESLRRSPEPLVSPDQAKEGVALLATMTIPLVR